jgi:hypothetical protein
MQSRRAFLQGLSLIVCIVAGMEIAQAAEPAAEQRVATVLDKPVYQKDVEVDPNDQSELRDYFAIAGRVLPPLVAKYVKDHKLTATPEEIKEYQTWFSAQRRRQPNPVEKDLPPEIRARLEESRIKSDTPGTPEYLGMQQIAKSFVERWKFNKTLHAKYGGRVIAQQLGPEPLDAYQAWLRDEIKAGHLRFDDPQWEASFWEYFEPEHHVFLDQPDPFKVPLWKMANNGQPGQN